MPEITVPLRLPELGHGTWLEGPAVSTRFARGAVVLVEFWEATCIHCLRALPYLTAWHRRYAGRGLVTVGVHTPEFTVSRGGTVAAAAVAEHDLPFPVLLDDERETWQRFANHYWPARYLADARGYLRYEHVGEGAYRETERWIQRLLREAGDEGEWPEPVAPVRPDDAPGTVCHRATPELHLGYHRGRLVAVEGYRPEAVVAHSGETPEGLVPGVFAARGRFRHRAEYLEVAEAGASLELICEATGIYCLLDAGPSPGEVEVELDGRPVPPELVGADLSPGPGGARGRWSGVRPLALVEARRFAPYHLQLTFPRPGIRAYAFSFTGCEPPAPSASADPASRR